MTSVDITFFESKSYFKSEFSVLESGDDKSYLESNKLEQMSSAKDKHLHVYERCILQPASDPTIMPMSPVQFLIDNLVRILLFLLDSNHDQPIAL